MSDALLAADCAELYTITSIESTLFSTKPGFLSTLAVSHIMLIYLLLTYVGQHDSRCHDAKAQQVIHQISMTGQSRQACASRPEKSF